MKILFISNTRLGDAILSSCILNAMHQRYPEARFTIAVGPVAAQAFEGVPNLDRLIIVKKEKHNKHWLKLWQQTVFNFWDIIIDCRGSAIGWLLPGKKRFCKYDPSTKQSHRVERYAKLLRSDDITLPKLWTTSEYEAKAQSLLPTDNPVIAVGPAANWDGKTWPAERFIELIKRIRAPDGPYPNAHIALIGAPNEREQIQPIIDSIPQDYLIDLIGTQHLLTIAACLTHCKLFVGNDSGLMHMAAAMGTPTIGLFGPTSKEKYGPYGPHCSIVSTPETPEQLMDIPNYHHQTCGSLMKSINVDDVFNAITG